MHIHTTGRLNEVPDMLTGMAEIMPYCTHADQHTVNGLKKAREAHVNLVSCQASPQLMGKTRQAGFNKNWLWVGEVAAYLSCTPLFPIPDAI